MNARLAIGATLFAMLASSGGRAQESPQATVTESSSYRYDPGESRWIAQEKARAAAALARLPVDILVAPFQVEGDSFDIVERSLMTRGLVAGLRARSNVVVADPALVEQALGSAARRISDDEILALARRTGAKTVVWGFVGHDTRGRFRFRVEWANFGALGAGQRTVASFDDIPFGDTDLPYHGFMARRDGIVDAIRGVAPVSAARKPAAANVVAAVPGSIDELETLAANPLQRAYLLQFLAVLHPTHTLDRARDALFERSVVALEGLEATAEVRTLRARAWTNLYRRPFAKSLLKTDSPAESAMSAYLDGNVERLTEALPRVGNPLAQLMATLELERLRLDYGGAPNPDVATMLMERYPSWARLLEQAFDQANSWSNGSLLTIKEALDEYWPVAKYDLQSAIKTLGLRGKPLAEYDLAELAYQHIDEVDDAEYASALATGHQDEGPSGADVVELLRQMWVATIVGRIDHLLVDNPAAALEQVGDFESLIADQPDFTISRGWAEFGASWERGEAEKNNLQKAGYEHLRQGSIWSQGQTDQTARVLPIHYQFFPGSDRMSAAEQARAFFDSDWPNRADWGRIAAVEDAEIVARLRHCVNYTIGNLQCLMELEAFLSKGSAAEAAALVAANRDRFVGHPTRIRFLARLQRNAGDETASVEYLADAITADSTDWEPYWRTGIGLAKIGQPQEALEAFRRYPGFRDSAITGRVALSNNAYEAGSILFWAGAYEEARPLYEFAAALDTGSEASIASSVRIALLDGDLETAARETLRRARQYGDAYSWRDLMVLSAALGHRDIAWTAFNGIQELLGNANFWVGAFGVQRIEGASLEAITAFAIEGERALPRTRLDSLAMRHIFLSQTTDREVTDALTSAMRDNDPGPYTLLDESGTVMLSDEEVSPNRHFGDPPRAPLNGSPPRRIDSRLTMAAMGLAALGKKDYPRAFEVFDEMSRIYDVREFVPYYAWAAAHVGDTARIERYLASSHEVAATAERTASWSFGAFFDEYLSRAFLAGFKGDNDAALIFLVKANADVLYTEERAVLTRYQIVEAAELLYAHSRDPRYRAFLLDMARRTAIIEPPYGWSHAFVAAYSDDAAERKTALARALYLDPLSKHALLAAPSEVRQARQLIDAGNPLLPTGDAL